MPNHDERKGTARLKTTEKSEKVIKKLIRGETITDAAIPAGLKVLNSKKDSGAVALWAAADAPNDEDSFSPAKAIKGFLQKSENKSIPAKAP